MATRGRQGTRRRSERTLRVGIYLPTAVLRKLRMTCVRDERSVSDAITEAVTDWLTKTWRRRG
jgi:hypothetical protein